MEEIVYDKDRQHSCKGCLVKMRQKCNLTTTL